VLGEAGVGCIVYSPLAQGLLTNRYLHGVPPDSRMAEGRFLTDSMMTSAVVDRIQALNKIAEHQGLSLAQLALAWTLRDSRVTSVLIGASSVEQLDNNLGVLAQLPLDEDTIAAIEPYAVSPTAG
jgi:L-glyceraldehyde 3-phosphate reductase